MNTPETEAVLGLYNDTVTKDDLVLAHFARRLERERNEAREDLQHAHKKLDAIQNTALEIIPGYGKTGLSTFTTPVSVMYRLRDEVNTLRAELKSEQEKALEWFIEFHALKNAVDETLEENRHLADGDNCTLKKLKDAYAKAKSAGHGLDSENAGAVTPGATETNLE
jgi:hypothetical protein